MCYGIYDSPLGDILLESDSEALTGLRFADAPAQLNAAISSEPEALAQTRRWLSLYFAGKIPDFTPPIRFCGSPFQLTVWRLLLEIPYGETVSYGEIAKRVASRLSVPRMSAQAVGGAVGRNPISLIVPCHRVVGANGSMTGYGGGIWRKEKLLALEHGVLACGS